VGVEEARTTNRSASVVVAISVGLHLATLGLVLWLVGSLQGYCDEIQARDWSDCLEPPHRFAIFVLALPFAVLLLINLLMAIAAVVAVVSSRRGR
jgi:hypothetical protein